MIRIVALALAGVLTLAALGGVRFPATSAISTIEIPIDYPTIQAGIDASSDGDAVLVQPGTYLENLNFHGKLIEVTSANGPDVTIIDGGYAGPVVTFTSGETTDAILRGFTIRHGDSTGLDNFGGGVLIRNSSPTLIANVIAENRSCSGAGGVAILSGSPRVEQNRISNNRQSSCTGGIGGAITVRNGSPVIDRNTIEGTRGSTGSGIGVQGTGAVVITNNVVRDNQNGSCGGGIRLVGASGEITQNVITANQADTAGGICIGAGFEPSTIVVSNNTVVWNLASDQIVVSGAPIGSAPRLSNNVVAGSISCGELIPGLVPPVLHSNNFYAGQAAEYTGSCSGALGVDGNISAHPMFVNAFDGDFRLAAGSPSIDAGNNGEATLGAVDIAGLPRVVDGDADGVAMVDQGAFEAPSGQTPEATHTPAPPLPTATPPEPPAILPSGPAGFIDTFQLVFGTPYGIDVAANGDVYVVTSQCVLWRIRDHEVTAAAGSSYNCLPEGDGGPPAAALLFNPRDVAIDPYGDIVIAEQCAIRKIAGGVIQTIAGGRCGSFGDGGPALLAGLGSPSGITFDTQGNLLFADTGNCVVRKVTNGIIDLVAGTGVCGYAGDGGAANLAAIHWPSGLAVDANEVVYFSESGTDFCRIRKVENGIISTFAGTGNCLFDGDGSAATAGMNPAGLDIVGDRMYVVDYSNVRLRLIEDGVITTIAGREFSSANGYGDGGPATLAALREPVDVALDLAGNVYISDAGDTRIRIVFSGAVSPTATPTPTQTPIPTNTHSPTSTPTSTPTHTETPTATPVSTDPECPDLNGDGAVTLADVITLIRRLGRKSHDPRYDLNNDGRVSGRDVALMLRAFGRTCD